MGASLTRIAELVRKEAIQVRRDRRMFGLILVMPVLELLIFGYVATTDIKHIAVAVCDYSRSQESRGYVEALVESGYFRTTGRCRRTADVDRELGRGAATVALVIPPDFAGRVRAGRGSEVLAVVDGSNSNTATIAVAYLEQITLAHGLTLVRAARSVPPGGPGRIEAIPRVWFNPELKSVNYMVPAMIAVLLFESLVIMTAMAIVREKERGTIEQLIVTPVRSLELILGKAIPFVALGYVNVTTVVLVGTLWFQVPLRGSVLLFRGGGLRSPSIPRSSRRARAGSRRGPLGSPRSPAGRFRSRRAA